MGCAVLSRSIQGADGPRTESEHDTDDRGQLLPHRKHRPRSMSSGMPREWATVRRAGFGCRAPPPTISARSTVAQARPRRCNCRAILLRLLFRRGAEFRLSSRLEHEPGGRPHRSCRRVAAGSTPACRWRGAIGTGWGPRPKGRPPLRPGADTVTTRHRRIAILRIVVLAWPVPSDPGHTRTWGFLPPRDEQTAS
jgi:hypothetical protein